jgi:SAM-dependent methyltransferase
VEDLRALQAMHRYQRWKADLLRPFLGSRVIEVGCGTGSFLWQLHGHERLVGVDRDGACVEAARARFGGRKDVEIRHLDVTDATFLRLADERPTSVVFVGSLDEIADDRRAIRHAADVLASRGRVVAFVSALPVLSGTLDKTYGQKRYRLQEAKDLLWAAGLGIVEAKYVNLLGAWGWLWDSRITRRKAVPPVAYRIRDVIVPIARLVDRLTGPPFGRSLLVVGEKGGSRA